MRDDTTLPQVSDEKWEGEKVLEFCGGVVEIGISGLEHD